MSRRIFHEIPSAFGGGAAASFGRLKPPTPKPKPSYVPVCCVACVACGALDRCVRYLSLGQVECDGDLVSAKPGQVIVRREVLLQFADLLLGERRSLLARFLTSCRGRCVVARRLLMLMS